jgi:predicted MFS family arabinose efflux permease
MQIVVAGWLMVSVDDSPLMVGLVQTAATLPSLLLALPGGVLADLVDRRRYLLAGQAMLLLVTIPMTVITGAGMLGAIPLLVATFVFGSVHAAQGPAWFTSQQQVLPDELKLPAIALGAASYSTARAIGPALGGALISAFGSTTALAAICLITAAAILLLLRSHSTPIVHHAGHVPEQFSEALRAGLRFVSRDRLVRLQLLRTSLFVIAGSGLWALLPLIADKSGASNASSYGLLLGSLGVGAVSGSLTLPIALKRLSARNLDLLGCIMFAAGTLTVVGSSHIGVGIGLCVMAGIGWAWVGNLNIMVVQMLSPLRIRSRSLAMYLITFQGSMSLGGFLWGATSETTSLATAAYLSAACQLVAAIIAYAMTRALYKAIETKE